GVVHLMGLLEDVQAVVEAAQALAAVLAVGGEHMATVLQVGGVRDRAGITRTRCGGYVGERTFSSTGCGTGSASVTGARCSLRGCGCAQSSTSSPTAVSRSIGPPGETSASPDMTSAMASNVIVG